MNNKTRGDQYKGELHKLQQVHCILYGGQDGYISKIDGEQMPEIVRQLCDGAMVTGGHANITVHFETGHDSIVPEAIIRGVQWYIGEAPTNDDVMADCIINAVLIDAAYNNAIKERNAKAKIETEQRARETEELPKQYHYLETVKAYEQRTGKKYASLVCAAQNIRRELARAFPGIKFSVRSKTFAGGDSIDIDWYDGVTTKEVEAITNKYNDHETDYTGDFRDPTNHVFNNIFGGAKYVIENRHMSKETEQALMPWANEMYQSQNCFAERACGRENLIWTLVSSYSIPANAKVTGAKHIDGVTVGSHVSDFYELVTS